MPKDVAGVMREFKHGQLHSGSKNGPSVTNRKQAVAIALSEQRQQKGGSSRSVSRNRTSSGEFDGPPASPGRGPLSHRPKVLNNAPTFAGRREDSRKRYY